MSQISETQLAEIADHLDCGLICYYHIKTGTIEHHPDDSSWDLEPEFYQDVIDKIEADPDNYIRFEPMDSREAFHVMERFANTISDEHLKKCLFDSINGPKPFRRFKNIIDDSSERQSWFDVNPEYALDHLLRLEIPAKSGTSGNFDAHRDDDHACASKLPWST